MRARLSAALRRRFYLVHGALLLVAGLLSARAATALSGLALQSEPTGSQARPDPSSPGEPPRERSFDAGLGAALFGVPLAATAAAPPESGAIACASADRSSLPLRLVGVSVFVETSAGLASIVANEGRSPGARAEVYGPGELVPPHARVLEVMADRVCIENVGTGFAELLLLDTPPAPRPPDGVARSERPAGAGDDRDLLEQLASGARVVPLMEDGKLTSVKLFGIRRGSIYDRAGMKNGDIVRAVAGRRVENPAQALELWAELKDRRHVDVEVERGGRRLTLTANR